MLSELKRKDFEKQGYRLVGNHSAIKVCMWTKKAIKCEDVCYKNTFYGINTHQCVQMTPALTACNHRCLHCWRDIAHAKKEWDGKVDDPAFIVEESIRQHTKYLNGFGGNSNAKLFDEAMKPKHFAISLSGEPTMYPLLPEFINEIHKRDMTSFLVTNGTNPEMLKKLIETNNEPTQLYISLSAPNAEVYKKACNPLISGGWEKVKESIAILNNMNTRKTIRLTLIKGVNLVHPEQYAEIFKKTTADFFELKAYVWVGYSRDRLQIENMPRHEEIKEFADEIVKAYPELEYVNEKPNSRVVLLKHKDNQTPDKIISN